LAAFFCHEFLETSIRLRILHFPFFHLAPFFRFLSELLSALGTRQSHVGWPHSAFIGITLQAKRGMTKWAIKMAVAGLIMNEYIIAATSGTTSHIASFCRRYLTFEKSHTCSLRVLIPRRGIVSENILNVTQ
jgi:hypothetical protein